MLEELKSLDVVEIDTEEGCFFPYLMCELNSDTAFRESFSDYLYDKVFNSKESDF